MFCRFCLVVSLCLVEAVHAAQIRGKVTDMEGQGLAYASVRLLEHPLGTTADAEGQFWLADTPSGMLTLQARSIGFREVEQTVEVSANDTASVVMRLRAEPISLESVVVTPGAFRIMQGVTSAPQTLTRDDIQSLPQLGEDIYRAVTRLPGVSSTDFSAKFTVRGGEHEEVLVRLDGMQLYEPFHLKDIYGGALSIVDVAVIDGIDLLTGGFGAVHGNHMSGVFDIRSLEPQTQRTSVGLSLMNARVMTQGTYADGRGSWLVSVRRGYLDIVLSIMNEDDFSPTYWDAYAKTQYNLSDAHEMSLHVLHASDQLEAGDSGDGDEIGSEYGNSYVWWGLQSVWSPRLTSHSLLSVGQVTADRGGVEFDEIGRNTPDGGFEWLRRQNFAVDEKRDVTLLGLRQDWSLQISERQLVDWGADLRWLSADYDYRSDSFDFTEVDGIVVPTTDSLRTRLRPDGSVVGLYGSTKLRVREPLTIEAGLRYDRVSYTEDSDVSPRLNAAWMLGPRTALRAGWGTFRQPQGIDDLQIPFGEESFQSSQRAEHRVIGVEHTLPAGLHVRVEGYQKKLTGLNSRWESLSKDVLFFPELEDDVVFLDPLRAEARGLEVYVRRDTGGWLTWWATYALARAEETYRTSGGLQDVPKNQDSRHTIYLDANMRPNRKWSFNIAWQYRSGWPYSERVFVPALRPEGEFPFRASYGPRHAARLSAYHRMDVKISRHFAIGDGRATLFLEAINLYDRANVVQQLPAWVSWQGPGTEPVTGGSSNEEWLPLMPSLGFRWDF